MRRRMLAACALAAMLMLSGHRPLNGEGYCYECLYGDPWYCMDCWHPVILGHVSCIPYCNATCLVGGPCQAGLRILDVSPDGMVLGAARGPAEPAGLDGPPPTPHFVERDCLGLITARRYDAMEAVKARADTRETWI